MKTLALVFISLVSAGAVLRAEDSLPKVYSPLRIMWNAKGQERWDEPARGFKMRSEPYLRPTKTRRIFRSADELMNFIHKQKPVVRESGFQIWWSCGPDEHRSDSEQKIVMQTAKELRLHGFRVFLESTDSPGFVEYRLPAER